jgi:hypothetical protein
VGEHVEEVGRELGIEVHPRAGGGVAEAERLRVEGLAREPGELVIEEAVVGSSGPAFHGDCTAVGHVAEKRMPDGLHVDPDLVRATGLELALD